MESFLKILDFSDLTLPGDFAESDQAHWAWSVSAKQPGKIINFAGGRRENLDTGLDRNFYPKFSEEFYAFSLDIKY